MPDTNIENTDSNNGENLHTDLENLEGDALKELVIKERGEKSELDSKNRQLFERAKTAEGFVKQDDGSWVKTEQKSEKKIKTESKSDKKSDEEFGLLELTFLKGEGVKSEEEIEFVEEQLAEAGLTNDKLPKLFKNKYFKAQLEEFRTEKANIKATSGVEGGGGESNAKNTPEYWKAKGVPPTKEQVPDRKTRVKIAKALIASTKSGKKFYNE